MSFTITPARIQRFVAHLENEERSAATIEKYTRDVRAFAAYLADLGAETVTKDLVIQYKNHLLQRFKPRSVNSMLAALNAFFTVMSRPALKVKSVKLQKELFSSAEKELTPAEFQSLCAAAQKVSPRLYLIFKTIAGTGIRVSELRFVTVEAVRRGRAVVQCKGKTRVVFIVAALQKMLLRYIAEQRIQSGEVFLNAEGNPLSRVSIWRQMKQAARLAGVRLGKVFPHNLRHLFARVFYNREKDLSKLADILGHSSVETTRIYTKSTGAEHIRLMENLGLV